MGDVHLIMQTALSDVLFPLFAFGNRPHSTRTKNFEQFIELQEDFTWAQDVLGGTAHLQLHPRAHPPPPCVNNRKVTKFHETYTKILHISPDLFFAWTYDAS